MIDLPSSLDPSGRDAWLGANGLRLIFSALRESGGEARVVGGAVRDALLGREVSEVDLAATLPPALVTETLQRAGLKVKPTGLAHGTVTAVHDGVGYEITTLRNDVETDGRHAKVAFTDDWQADATRRDFTINAIYTDESGKLYDYHHGREDLAAGRVRFIGDARQRIQEDVLRILRFFRFSAWFVGKDKDIDSEGLSACRELASLVPHLSIERVTRELLKLLAAQNPLPAWRCMATCGVVSSVLPEATADYGRFESLISLEQRLYRENLLLFPSAYPVGLLRLASLLPAEPGICETVAKRLKLSNRDMACLVALGALPSMLAREYLSRGAFRRAIYHHGSGLALAALLLACIDHSDLLAGLSPILGEAQSWKPVVFPVRGKDLSLLGIADGPQMGNTLRRLEEWWIAQDFQPTKEECLAQVQKLNPGL